MINTYQQENMSVCSPMQTGGSVHFGSRVSRSRMHVCLKGVEPLILYPCSQSMVQDVPYARVHGSSTNPFSGADSFSHSLGSQNVVVPVQVDRGPHVRLMDPIRMKPSSQLNSQ